MSNPAYRIQIKADEIESLAWLAARYQYAQLLYDSLNQESGEIQLAEHEAWEFQECVDSQVDGGYMPCLDPRSRLYQNIQDFLSSIV
jgi:hypothetical protein